MFRLSSFRIHQSLVGDKAVDIESYWPITGQKKEKITYVADKEMFERIKKAHNVK